MEIDLTCTTYHLLKHIEVQLECKLDQDWVKVEQSVVTTGKTMEEHSIVHGSYLTDDL